MILDVIQTSKELLTADFVVKRGDTQVGNFFVEGSLFSMKVSVSGRLFGRDFDFQYGEGENIDAPNPFKPYTINKNGLYNGTVYQTRAGGLFKGFDYTQMIKSGVTYNSFGVGLGKEGGKVCLYHGNTQIAQTDTESVIYNDLFNFKIYAQNEFAGEIAVLFEIYGYSVSCFEPGQKVTWSKEVVYSKDTNKALLAKYNPDFVKTIEE